MAEGRMPNLSRLAERAGFAPQLRLPRRVPRRAASSIRRIHVEEVLVRSPERHVVSSVLELRLDGRAERAFLGSESPATDEPYPYLYLARTSRQLAPKSRLRFCRSPRMSTSLTAVTCSTLWGTCTEKW